MEIREIMTRDPEACLPTDSCAAAGQIMERRKCGFVPVVESHDTKRVVGVLTDRDLALYLARGTDPANLVPVGLVMTKDVKTASPDTELEQAAQIMEDAAIHRLPVVENGRLVGVLALKDIALRARKQWATAGPNVAERQMTEIIEAIAAAR